MKNNLPITQHEVDYAESQVFVTKTDTRGGITYVNDSFVQISGFSREELLGKNHNLVRHPDMPEWAFKSLWETVESGHPWRGIVKNRAKSGDHYWVRATVSPITDRGVVTGYISLRKKPTRAEVAAAEALYKSGRVPSAKLPLFRRFRNLTLQTKLQLLIQPALLLMLSVGSFSIVNDNKASMFDSAQRRAQGVANEIIDSANMLMVTGQISDVNTRQLLMNKISDSGNIVALRLMRTEHVVKQFGPGLPEEQIQDELQRSVIASKKPYYALENRDGKPIFRAVTPYMVSRDFHGTDCLSCHQVEDGSVNGVSDIQIDLSGGFYDDLNKVIVEQILIQLAFQLVLFFFIRLIVRRFVVRPVDEIKQHLSELINGQMSGQVDISGRDEMGEVLCSVQSTKVLLGSIIDQISSVSGHIDNRARHLSEAMTKVAEGSQSQSAAANSMSIAVEKMTASIDQIAENAGEVRRVSDNSTSLAAEGGKIVRQVVDDMSKTNQAVLNTAQTMRNLGEQSDQIQNVVKVIKEIADQTNLLALNAAIEAARAGEQGRGFAVVADEVRKLAEKTARSTQEIAGMVDEIRGSTSNAIAEMVATVEMVKAGSVQAEQAGGAIVKINEGVSRVLSGVEDISSSIREQSLASREIADNVERVARMSGENSEAIRDVFGTVGNLETLSSALDQSVSHFRI
ncbi:MAG: PAS domain-containing methyl-accepting chemotaxis protein [Gallionella sp.]|nr:PAS domain-containing methyl-accepting chemotaxis protein [Gallionella sp.]